MRSILLRMVESCASVDCFSCRSFARYDRWRRARCPRDLPILCESSSMASLVDDANDTAATRPLRNEHPQTNSVFVSI